MGVTVWADENLEISLNARTNSGIQADVRKRCMTCSLLSSDPL